MNNPPTILVSILYWHQDQKQAEAVTRIICDLLDEPTECELMMEARYDSPLASPQVQAYAQQKFAKVHVWKCNRKALGFPGGCNEMAYGLLNHITIQRHLGHGFKNIDAILLLEADCVITRKNWIKELKEAWKEAKEQSKLVVGALQPAYTWSPGSTASAHINAVALYDSDIVRYIPELRGGPNQTGWDHFHGPTILPHAVNSPLFKLDYRRPTIGQEELFASNALVYHGVKDDSALKAIRKKYNI
jgi:hypothetical protein